MLLVLQRHQYTLDRPFSYACSQPWLVAGATTAILSSLTAPLVGFIKQRFYFSSHLVKCLNILSLDCQSLIPIVGNVLCEVKVVPNLKTESWSIKFSLLFVTEITCLKIHHLDLSAAQPAELTFERSIMILVYEHQDSVRLHRKHTEAYVFLLLSSH